MKLFSNLLFHITLPNFGSGLFAKSDERVQVLSLSRSTPEYFLKVLESLFLKFQIDSFFLFYNEMGVDPFFKKVLG